MLKRKRLGNPRSPRVEFEICGTPFTYLVRYELRGKRTFLPCYELKKAGTFVRTFHKVAELMGFVKGEL